MKKLFLALLIVAVLSAPAWAGDRKNVEAAHDSNDSMSVSVSLLSTVYTKSFPIFRMEAQQQLPVVYQQTPATGDTAIYFEQSVQRPTTEYVIDATYLQTDDIDITTTGTLNWQMATLDSVELMYGRFRIEGQNSNPTSTVTTIKYVK